MISTYPVNGTLQYMLSGGPSSSNPVTSGKNLTLFVVTVPSTWQAGPENSPFQGVVDPNSPFIVNWTTPNLIFYDPNNNVFANLVRNVTTLTFPYNYDINVSGRIQPVNSTCQYRWDMATGVLLSYYINITNTADSFIRWVFFNVVIRNQCMEFTYCQCFGFSFGMDYDQFHVNYDSNIFLSKETHTQ